MRFTHVIIVAALAWGTGFMGIGRAAEQLNLVLGSNSTSGILISTTDLRTFAQTGTAPSSLQSMLSLMSPEMLEKLQTALKTNYPVDVEDLKQRAKTENGMKVLEGLAAATLRPGPEGVSEIETAILKSASNPQGFNLIDFIEAYPEPVLNLDINQIQAFINTNENLVALATQKLEGNGTPVNSSTP